VLFSIWWENHSWFSSKEKHYYHLSKKNKRKNTITKRVMELTWKFWVVHSWWTAFSWNAMDSTNFGKNVVYCIVDFMSSWICQDLIVGHELITKFCICIYSYAICKIDPQFWTTNYAVHHLGCIQILLYKRGRQIHEAKQREMLFPVTMTNHKHLLFCTSDWIFFYLVFAIL